MSDRIYLDVPFREKDEAKQLGARWDPHHKQWWAPPDADPALFGRWLVPEPRVFTGHKIAVRVVQLPERCWKCAERSLPIVGVELPGRWEAYPDDGWADFGDSAEVILATLPAEQLASLDVGPIQWRRTELVPDGYWANTCPYCDATFGNFPLYEGLQDAYMEGLERHQLPAFEAELPIDGFESDEDYWALMAHENRWDQDEPAGGEISAPTRAPRPPGLALANDKDEDEASAPSAADTPGGAAGGRLAAAVGDGPEGASSPPARRLLNRLIGRAGRGRGGAAGEPH